MKKYLFIMMVIVLLISTPISVFSQTRVDSSAVNTLSLNFRNISTRDLLQLLAEFNNSNIVMSDAVKGYMSLRLENVSWRQAVNTILSMQGLSLRQQGNILFVAPTSEFDIRDQQQQAQEMSTTLISLHYAKASELVELLQNKTNGLLSATGSVSADIRTNTLIARDLPSRLQQIRALVSKLDMPVQQVMIAARIVNVDEDFVRDLGIKFGTVPGNVATSFDNLTMDMPAANTPQAGQFNIAIAKMSGSTLLDLELLALESEGHAKIISNPKLMTVNRQQAVIESGQEIPYQEKTSSGATNVAFKKAVLSLKVTPEITSDNKILLNLIVNQDKISPMLVNGVPAINTQEVQTQIIVNNAQTIVLGGIYEQINRNMVERIPFLGAIPGVGALFSSKQTKTERKELLIFVTPKIYE